MSKTVNVVVTPKKNESAEKMIRRFTKKVKKEGILEEVRDRAYYVKPSEEKELCANCNKKETERNRTTN